MRLSEAVSAAPRIEVAVSGARGAPSTVPGPPGDVSRVATRGAMAALAATAGLTRVLSEAGREGLFVFDTSDLSARVAADVAQALYVAPVSDLDGSSGAWVRVFEGAVNARWFGASPAAADNLTALQRLFDFCRDFDLQWRIPSGSYAISGQLTCYTGGYCDGIILVPNNGAASNYFLVSPKTADITAIPAATVNGWGFHTKGTSEHADAAPYAGKAVWWTTSDEVAIDRFGAAGLNIAETIIVNEGGKFYPPITYTKTVAWANVEAQAVTIREPLIIHDLKIKATTGAAESEGFVQVTRPNVIFKGGWLKNDTATAMRSGLNFYTTGAMCRVESFDIADLLDTTTNYAYHAGSADLTLVGCTERNCRRGFDGQMSKLATIIGGSYPDGIGGHWHHGLYASGGAYISADLSNSAPLLMSGGDLSVIGCKLRLTDEITTLFAVRGDMYELSGTLRIDDCDIEIDVKTALATPRVLLGLNESSATNGHDWGRLVYLPSHVSFRNNRVKQYGATYSARTTVFTFGSNRSFVDGLSAGGRIDVSKNSWDFEGGDAALKFATVVVKDTLWNNGPGYEICLADFPSLQSYNLCAVARADNNQRNNYYIERVGSLTLQLSLGAYQTAQYAARAPTVAAPGGGRVTAAGDEIIGRTGPVRTGLLVWNIASTAAGGFATTTIAVPGAGAGMIASVGIDNIATSALPAGWLLFAQVTAADTVTVTAFNGTGGVSDPASMNLRVRVV